MTEKEIKAMLKLADALSKQGVPIQSIVSPKVKLDGMKEILKGKDPDEVAKPIADKMKSFTKNAFKQLADQGKKSKTSKPKKVKIKAPKPKIFQGMSPEDAENLFKVASSYWKQNKPKHWSKSAPKGSPIQIRVLFPTKADREAALKEIGKNKDLKFMVRAELYKPLKTSEKRKVKFHALPVIDAPTKKKLMKILDKHKVEYLDGKKMLESVSSRMKPLLE